MKKLMAVVAWITVALAGSAWATVINSGFESGDFSGWNLSIPAGATAAVTGNHTSDLGHLYTPVAGNHFALLKTDGPGNITMISQQVSLLAGESIDGWAAFDAQDYVPYMDWAYVQIMDPSGAITATPWFEQIGGTVPSYADTPWTYWTWTAGSTGTYMLTYGVANSGDSGMDSYALFDSGDRGEQPVPEPGTMLLFGVGLCGFAILGKKLGPSAPSQ